MPGRKLRVGTRGSKLALAQTKIVTGLLTSVWHQVAVKVVSIATAGDVLPPEKRIETDGKTAFTREIENHLLAGEIDLAVHSLKDLPNQLHDSLTIGATPPRGDARDALVSRSGEDIRHLSASSRIGTSSIRRKAQLLQARRDLVISEVHGNIETRLRKMEELGLDGVVLAAAGLKRTGLDGRITQLFDVTEMVPAVGQGIIAVEMRKDDRELGQLLSKIDDEVTRLAAVCERTFSSALGGDCHVPIGAYSEVVGERLRATGVIVSPDGVDIAKETMYGEARDPTALGMKLANALLDSGGVAILEAARG